MNKLIQYSIFNFIVLSSTLLYADNLNLKIFSSQTGLAVITDYVVIYNYYNPHEYISLKKNSDNFFSANLPNGSYHVFVKADGYFSSSTEFSLQNNQVNYSFFLDPINSHHLLTQNRIKSLLQQNKALILGFVSDFNSGKPVANVNIFLNSNQLLAKSDQNGFFQFSLFADCEIRNFINLSFQHSNYEMDIFNNFEINPNTDYVFTIRLKKELSNNFNYISKENCSDCFSHKIINDLPSSGFVLPMNIRVGRNCTGTNCTYAEVFTLQTYCKRVLPAEIYACWGNLSGGMNSLQASAVAVRTYGIYYVYNPINPSLYDICDNTYCQFFGNTQSTNTNIAVDNTYGNILSNSSGVVRSEYSAENNNKGCGNSYSGTGTSWPCIYDPVCSGYSPNGHGRGLCQWGTVRWATGRNITTSSPCTQGISHPYGTKSWQQILNHYYNVSPYNWQLIEANFASINSASSSPSSANPCQQISIIMNITANNQQAYLLGASIALSGTSNWISNPQNDVKRIISSGTGYYSRSFVLPCNIPPGSYDLLTALWYDKNNNNLIDGGDFVVNSFLTPNALSISPIGIKPINSEIPLHYSLMQNYPNPFNPITNIQFAIPKSGFVKLKIFNVLGKEVETLVNEVLSAGYFNVNWNASTYPSGVYFYRIETVEFSKSIPMVLLK